MEIQGEPFKKRNGEDVKWLRFELYKTQEGFQVIVGGTFIEEHDFLYVCDIDNQTFTKIQKEQSIKICQNDFAKRVATLLDYCLLQMHCSCQQESRFTCVFNEHESEPNKYLFHICEQNEFRNLVHVTLPFVRASSDGQSLSHFSKMHAQEAMSQRLIKQKMILLQKNRDNIQAMYQINSSLKMLKSEHLRVVDDLSQRHSQEVAELRENWDQEHEQIQSGHI